MYPNVSFEDQVEDQDLKTQSLDPRVQTLLIMVTLKMFPMNANTPESRSSDFVCGNFLPFYRKYVFIKKFCGKLPEFWEKSHQNEFFLKRFSKIV
jgi:hypothetical protein